MAEEIEDSLAATGDEFTSYGVFVVQNIDRVATELYLGVRNHELDRVGANFDDIFAVLGGARIKFQAVCAMTNIARQFGRPALRALAVAAIVGGFSACSGIEPFAYTEVHEIKPGPGLFSGADGEFVLYSR